MNGWYLGEPLYVQSCSFMYDYGIRYNLQDIFSKQSISTNLKSHKQINSY